MTPNPDAASSGITWSDELAAWVVHSYKDVVAILQDDRFSATSGTAPSGPDGSLPPDPVHEASRQHIVKTFRASVPWVATVMTEEMAPFLEKFDRRSRFDLQSDVIQPWCQCLAMRLNGRDPSAKEAPILHQAALDMFQLTSVAPIEKATHDKGCDAIAILAHYASEMLQRDHRSSVRHLPARLARGRHSVGELTAACVQLFAGFSTSVPLLLGNIMNRLYTTPSEASHYLQAPQGCPRTVNALLRVAGPAQFIYRRSRVKITFGEHTFRPGDRIALALAEANRDPAIFKHPESIDSGEREASHVSLGMGAHACLGAPLIREACSYLPRAILQHFPTSLYAIDTHARRPGGNRTISGFSEIPLVRRPSAPGATQKS